MVYLDDVIIFTKTREEHVGKLERVFQALCKFDLKISTDLTTVAEASKVPWLLAQREVAVKTLFFNSNIFW
jgi:hypothetical protein